MKRLILSIAAVVAVAVTCLAAGRDTYTVIVSLDGFRWDYAEAYDTPLLDKMAQQGVKAVMTPSFPSKTFPNHYTLATGLVPDHHGIIANSFLDRKTGDIYSLSNMKTKNNPKYYGGDPVWLTAKRQGVTSATVYWVGSDVNLNGGGHADYWQDYNHKPRLKPYERVNEVIRLLSLSEDKRPHLIMAYFEEPDASGHSHGPASAQTRARFEDLDLMLATLWNRMQELPIADKINFIVTGDHGMTWLNPERTVPVKKYLKTEWIKTIENDVPAMLYVTEPRFADSIVSALKCVDHIRVWKKDEIPAYLNFGTNPNVGDVIVLPDVGWTFSDRKAGLMTGTHGFDHTCSDMWVGFRAIGPDFKRGYTRESTFRNVCIYPLLCYLLGITPSENDGDMNEVSDLIRTGN